MGGLDPAGDDLCERLGLAGPDGAAALAAAARHGLSPEMLMEHTVAVTDRCRLLVGRPGRTGTAAMLGVLAERLPEAARAAGLVGHWDLGRIDVASPARPVMLACDLVVVMARPTPGELAHAVPLLEGLTGAALPTVGLVLGPMPRRARAAYSDTEVAAALGEQLSCPVAVLGRVPHDPLGVAMAERVLPRWAGRCPLGKAARLLAETIAAATAPAAAEVSG
jgi:hypothetical protein